MSLSEANNLVSRDTNSIADVFVRDMKSGTTLLASPGARSTHPTTPSGSSEAPERSADGRYVVFISNADLTGATGSGSYHVYLRDTQSGTTTLIDTVLAASPGGGVTPAATPRFSAEGRFVVFESASPELAEGDRNRCFDVFLRDTQTNSVELISSTLPTLVSQTPNGISSLAPFSISAAGQSVAFSSDRYVAFAGFANDLVPGDTNRFTDVFLRDLAVGSTVAVSIAADGSTWGNGDSFSPILGSDGRLALFRSRAKNLVAGLVFNTTLLSLNQAGSSTADNRSLRPLFSADSRMLFFQSWATDLAGGDLNHSSDIYAWTLHSSGTIPYFSAQLLLAEPGMGSVITWPVVPGKSYSVQYKDNLDDPDWQDAGHGVLVGNQGWFRDPAAPSQRFYRVVAH